MRTRFPAGIREIFEAEADPRCPDINFLVRPTCVRGAGSAPRARGLGRLAQSGEGRAVSLYEGSGYSRAGSCTGHGSAERERPRERERPSPSRERERQSERKRERGTRSNEKGGSTRDAGLYRCVCPDRRPIDANAVSFRSRSLVLSFALSRRCLSATQPCRIMPAVKSNLNLSASTSAGRRVRRSPRRRLCPPLTSPEINIFSLVCTSIDTPERH